MAISGIPDTMKGLQIREFKKPYHYARDIPVPKIVQNNEVLIKIAVAGYCHTEMMVQNGEFENRMGPGDKLPLIPSHEGTGIVVGVGSQVSNVKVQQLWHMSYIMFLRSSSRYAGRRPRRELILQKSMHELF